MQQNNATVSLWPTQASTLAWETDLFYAAMIAISLFFIVLIVGLLLYFSIKYRRREGDYRPPHVETSKALEILWSVIPLFMVVGMFVWGAELFFRQEYVPENGLPIQVTGKQWMFKFQHPNGRREINALHVPLGQPVRLTMSSEDVIHNLFIPDFRIKKDLVPGRYTTLWFEATKTGEFHLFCNQYCGTQHSNMIGRVIVMHPTAYQNWLSGYTGEPPVKAGEALFTKHACNTCHNLEGGSARGPALAGLMGTSVQFADGSVLKSVDRNYIRESILKPQEKIVAGFTPIMPSFQGLLTEEEVNNLITYIESLSAGTGQPSAQVPSGGQTVQAATSGGSTYEANKVHGQMNQRGPEPASAGSGHGAAVAPDTATRTVPLSGSGTVTETTAPVSVQRDPSEAQRTETAPAATPAPVPVSTPAPGSTDAATTSSTATQEAR